MRKPTTAMTHEELQREADAVADRIARGAATVMDAAVVIELANRLIRTSADERAVCDGKHKCADPKQKVTHQGVTYLDWQCENCGGTGRESWD